MKHVFILLILFSFVALAGITVDTLNTTRLTADSLFGDASKLSGTKAEKFWGGMSQYRFSVEINTHSSTPYLVIGNKPYPGDSMALHLSATGIGNAEEIKVIMPDSIALTAGSATTLQENYIYYHYNGGAPVLMVSATNLSHSNKGAVSDSLVGIGNFGLGTASVSDVVIGKYNEYRDVLNKFSMHAGHRMRIKTTYESDDGSDLLPTVRSKSLAVAGGLALQSRHTYCPPFDNRDGDKLISPVFADSAYAEWDSLSDFYEYSTGEAIGADQEFWIVLWESVSEDSTRSQLYINIQAGTNTYK